VTDSLSWFLRGIRLVDRVVGLAPDYAWERESPCEGWTARHVLGHIIATQHYYVSVIEARSPTMDPMNAPDRHAGEDPSATWEKARDTVQRVFASPGVQDRVVVTFQGEQRVGDMIAFNVVDNTVHSWDLAKAFGIDDTLDPALVTRSLEIVDTAAEALAAAGVFGTPVVASDADSQTRLLAALGRRADWQPA
jgi:uncharacterized protein (TIGR03086 family)